MLSSRRRLIQGGVASGLVLLAAWSLVGRSSAPPPPAPAPQTTAAATNTAPPGDTVPPGYTVVAGDTAVPANTAVAGDTAVPANTAVAGDTAVPANTAVAGDTALAANTAPPADTAAAATTSAPVADSPSAVAESPSAAPEMPLSALLGAPKSSAQHETPSVPLSVLLGGGDGEPEGPQVSEAAQSDSPAPPAAPSAAPDAQAAFVDRYFPFLADEREAGSISVGDTSYGYLIGARHIQESDALGILPRQKARDLGYGTDQITLLLEDAARKFHGRTRTRFWIGNIARRSGGDIPYSVSHNSGRDADVALAYTDAKGSPADPPDLLSVDPYGTTRDKERKYRFDAARTWQVIRALIESDKAQIEYLFLARALTEKVLRHAQEKKEPAQIIERATEVLLQPGGAPHDDHLHVRVYCGERDVEGGCLNMGPVRTGARLYTSARGRRVERSVAAMKSDEPEQRARGVERLLLLQATDRKDDVAAMLDDASGRVRAASATALAEWGSGEEASRIAKKLVNEEDPVARAAMMGALSMMGGAAAGDYFAVALDRAGTLPWGRVAEAASQPGSPTPFLILAEALSPLPLLAPHIGFLEEGEGEPAFAMKLYIIDAAGFCDRPEPVAPLFSLLADTDPSVRAHAAMALSRLVNRPVPPALIDPSAPSDVVMKAAIDLQNQAIPLRRGDRGSWIAEGFSRAGFKVPRIEADNAWEILRAFGAGEPYSYNAGRALARIALGNTEAEAGKKKPPRPPVFEETVAECRYWLRWLESHKGKLHLSKPPDNIGAACK